MHMDIDMDMDMHMDVHVDMDMDMDLPTSGAHGRVALGTDRRPRREAHEPHSDASVAIDLSRERTKKME